VKGVGGFIHELFCAPFGSNPLLWPLNFLFNVVEYVSKPLSHSLRLFGNMYAGEIIFLLLWLMASGRSWAFSPSVLGWGWAIFHILIVALQAYIFMMLTIVYIQMAHERALSADFLANPTPLVKPKGQRQWTQNFKCSP
jgi:F-type H+-transporting ATPase subunit a